ESLSCHRRPGTLRGLAPDDRHWRCVCSVHYSSFPASSDIASQHKLRLLFRSVSCNQNQSQGWLTVAVEVHLHQTGAAVPMILLKESPAVVAEVRQSDKLCSRIPGCNFSCKP